MASTSSEPHLVRRNTSMSPWWHHLVWFAAMLLVLEVVQQMRGDWFRWLATVRYNPQFQEGWAWWHGRLDLRFWLWDTAQVPDQNKVFNVYPPLQSIIGFILEAPYARQEEMPSYHWLPFLLFALPLPFIGYRVFLKRTSSAGWAALLALGWLGGTALMPCVAAGRKDDFHHINHLLSQMGLMILACEYFGKRRWWVMLSALLITAWSRQLTGFFAIAVIYSALFRPDTNEETPARTRPAFRSRLLTLTIGLAVIVGVPMALNGAKFGNPFDSGYELIYHGRNTQAAMNVRAHGLFSYHFVPTNAFYMNVATPWAPDEDGRIIWKPSPDGGSLWLSTPLALLVWIGVRSWWRDTAARVLMLCSLPIICGHLFYHNTGYIQFAYYRFALDYLPIWLVVAAPWLVTGWRRWATPIAVGWSLVYFTMMRHWSGPDAI